MKNEVFDKETLNTQIFRLSSSRKSLITRESTKLEFKETFNFAEIAEYLKDFAAFSNNSGGYLVFGVEDSPHTLVGIDGAAFDKIDEEKITGFVNEYFAPSIEWQKTIYEIGGKHYGLIYVSESFDKPVIALKDGGRGQEIKNGEIYYRYIGRSQKIRYSELRQILDAKLAQERKALQQHLEKMIKIGPDNVAVLDINKGTIEGTSGTILIDDELIPKLKFIKEGHFVDKNGKPTLKLIGELKPTSVIQKIIHDDPYIFRPSDVADEVQKRLQMPFKVNPHHERAWKHFKVRSKQEDGSWITDLKYCDYKQKIKYFLYNQQWIDLLVNELSNPSLYKKIVG